MKITFVRAQAGIASLLVGWLLTACGGGDDDAPPPPTILAVADALSIANGATGNLLANDTLGGVAVSTSTVTFALSAASTVPTGLSVTGGVVTVGASAVPGNVNLSYTICQTATPTNCATGTAVITIPAPPIVATADTFNLAAGASGDLLANDTLGGAAATAATVTVSTTTTLPTGITVSAGGVVSVGATAAAGTTVIGYRICQTVAPANCATANATVTVPVLGTVTGTAIDGATGAGIAGVTVTAGAATTTTDASGNFSLSGVGVSTRQSVNFSSTTYAETSRITAVQATGNTNVQARMVRIAATGSVAVSSGGTVGVAGSPAQVVLGADAVQRADGSIPTGNISVALTPINPAVDTTTMPGDFTTLVSGTATPIESFGALNVVLQDSAGAALNLRAGQTATIRIPAASRNSTLPATIPLFYFDTASGRWVQEGSATLAGTAPSQYYQGTVTHFTTWNADQVYNTVRVTGCVADANGVRVVGATVYSDGINYSGTSTAVTDAAGNFTIPIRLGSIATLVGVSAGRLTNTFSAGSYSSDTTLSSCLALGSTGAGITMKLTWGQLPSDLDSHLFAPNGSHVYYSSKGALTAVPFANLDVDDTSSYGPEVVTISKLMVGTYKYSVYNYSGYGAGPIGASQARVELNIPGRSLELFTPPTTGETAGTGWWNLLEFDVDASCNITLRRVGTFSASSPSTTSVTPVYCTAP